MRVLSLLSLAIVAMPVGAQFGMPLKQRSEPSRGDRRRLSDLQAVEGALFFPHFGALALCSCCGSNVLSGYWSPSESLHRYAWSRAQCAARSKPGNSCVLVIKPPRGPLGVPLAPFLRVSVLRESEPAVMTENLRNLTDYRSSLSTTLLLIRLHEIVPDDVTGPRT